MSTRRLAWTALLALLLASSAAAAPEADRAARQAAIEAGDGLSERARGVLFRARASLDEGKAAAAADQLQAWLAGGPGRDHPLLRCELGVALLAAGQVGQAVPELEAAVAAEPAFGRAWLRLGEAAYETGAYADAAEAFLRADALLAEPSPELRHYAGVCRLQAGDASGACDILEPLVASAAEPPLAWHRALASAALAAEAPGRARPAMQRLLASRAEDPAAWDLAWRFAAGTGAYRDAAVLLKAEGFLATLDVQELEQLGDLCAAAGVPLEAARAWERALELRAAQELPAAAGAERLARAWLAAHEPGRAQAVLRGALAAAPDARLFALLGDACLAGDDPAAAADAYARAAAADPAAGRAVLMAGWCALEAGQAQAARPYLKAALEFSEYAPTARALLAGLDRPTP